MGPSASFVLALLEEQEVRIVPDYRKAIEALDWPAFASALDAFQESARTAASSRRGLARVLEGHAEAELSGAGIIDLVGNAAEHNGVRSLLRRHAADEKRHSRIFHALSRLVDPECAEEGTYPKLRPDPFADQFEGDLGSFYCDAHFAEIRNYFYLNFLKDVLPLPVSDPGVRRKLRSGLARIISDEKRHIAGTGMLINGSQWREGGLQMHLNIAFDHYVTFIREEAAA